MALQQESGTVGLYAVIQIEKNEFHLELSSELNGPLNQVVTSSKRGQQLHENNSFQLQIVNLLDGIEVTIIGHHVKLLLPHSVDTDKLTHLMLSGDAEFEDVEFPTEMVMHYYNLLPQRLFQINFQVDMDDAKSSL